MRRMSLFLLLLLLLSPLPAHAKSRAHTAPTVANATAAEQQVLADFQQILDLWRDGKYNDLFDRTLTGHESKEEFAKRLASAPRRPACCWEKMQDARVSLKTARSAVVHAKLGFEGSLPGTEYVTKGITLKKEDGVWMISASDLYNLANLKKKRVRYKYLPIQPKP